MLRITPRREKTAPKQTIKPLEKEMMSDVNLCAQYLLLQTSGQQCPTIQCQHNLFIEVIKALGGIIQ